MENKGLKRFEFILVLLFIINLSACKELELKPELELLLSFKASINDQFQSLGNWNPSQSFCKFSGITCLASSHVSKIELQSKNLSGKIPQSIFQLPYIQSVDLSNNQLFGLIPRINSSSSLRFLNLSTNNLTGPIPGDGHFPALETLDLSDNMLSGQIPGNIGFIFPGLKMLDFGGNLLSGPIPDSLTNLTGLETLTLASNQLTGEIPAKLGLMKRLTWIYLGYNNLSGGIPAEIGGLTSLSHLDLVFNNLTGEIPSSLGNLTNLENFFLYFNKLSGPIPKSIFNLRKLVSLDLSDNSLSGEIPEMFVNLQKLEILHLFSNNFSGKIPNALSSLPHLQVLQLWSNRLSGEIPRDLGKHNNLTVLDLSTNNLTGKIPDNLCASRRLFKLILFSNSLEGEIPESLSLCRSLQRVRIQKNRLSGRISPGFTTLPMVYFLDVSSNNFSGRIDDRNWDMPQLQMLNMAGNGFSGQLPDSFGSEKLENLDLSGNYFSGRIPQSFGGFSQLMELKLSQNQLSDQIPDELSDCKKLVTIDLSNNHLSGEIPTSFASMPVLGLLDLSQNSLTGKIPANLGTVESLVQINISYNHFHGNLPTTGAFLAINSSAVAGNNLCGGAKTSDLLPCNDGVDKNHVRWFVLTSLLATLTIFAIVIVFIRVRKGGVELKKVETEDGAWELQFLNSSKFSRLITIKDIISSIKEGNLVGNGRIGLSYKGKITTALINKNKKSGNYFLAKEIASVSRSCWMNWAETFKNIDHPNVVKLLAMCRSETSGILVYEFVEGKNLSEIVQDLSWETRLKIAVGVSKAVQYLHCSCSPGVIIGEVSTRKIIVAEKDEAHLRLSLPRISLGSDKKCKASSAYVAPEIVKGAKGQTEKSDIYGFGILLIELLTGKSPVDPELGIHDTIVSWARYCYSDCHLEMWVDSMIKNSDQVLDDHQNQIVETMNLALQCTAGDPTARPGAMEVLKNLELIVRSRSSCVFPGLGFNKLFSASV